MRLQLGQSEGRITEATTDGKGEFQFQARLWEFPKPLHLEAPPESGWYQTQPTSFASGYAKVVIVVGRRTAIEGKVKTSGTPFASPATITAIPLGLGPHANSQKHPYSVLYEGDTDFRITDVMPGLYRIEMTIHGQVVGHADDVLVGGEALAPDANLDPLSYLVKMEEFDLDLCSHFRLLTRQRLRA